MITYNIVNNGESSDEPVNVYLQKTSAGDIELVAQKGMRYQIPLRLAVDGCMTRYGLNVGEAKRIGLQVDSDGRIKEV